MMLVCVKCNLEYRTAKIGVAVEVMAGQDPYQLFAADLLRCPGCGHELARAANTPISEHFKVEFLGLVQHYQRSEKVVRAWKTLQEKQGAEQPAASEVTA